MDEISNAEIEVHDDYVVLHGDPRGVNFGSVDKEFVNKLVNLDRLWDRYQKKKEEVEVGFKDRFREFALKGVYDFQGEAKELIRRAFTA